MIAIGNFGSRAEVPTSATTSGRGVWPSLAGFHATRDSEQPVMARQICSRDALEQETDIVKNCGVNDLTSAEEFAGRRCFVLEMLHKQKDKTLLRGQIRVDVDTFPLRRTSRYVAYKIADLVAARAE